RYLDLARFETLTQTEPITRAELNRLLGAAPAQVRSLLETEGYFSADSSISLLRDGSGSGAVETVQLQLVVLPGPRTQVGQVDLQARGALADAAAAGNADAQALLQRLRQDWRLPTGRPFLQADWSEAKTRVLTLLRAEGYATPAWLSTEARVQPAEQRADLLLQIDSGPLHRIGPLRYEGLEHVEADALRALLTFTPGEPLREQPLQDYQERLVRTGLFDTVSVVALPATGQTEVPVTVRLGERALHQITLGLGVSDSTGPRVTLEHLNQALLGYGWQARSKLQYGRDAQSIALDLTSHPKPGPYRNLISGALTRTEAGGLQVTGEKLRLGRTQDTEQIERLYYFEWQRALTRPVDGGPISDDVSSLSYNYQWVWRDLDSAILPTRGVSASAEAGFGHSFHTASDSGWFSRGTARLTGYWPFGASWYGQARLQLGQVVPTSVSVPYTLLFRAGGDDSVRGYAYQSLGPSDAAGTALGGRVLATSSVELARPVSPQLASVWMAAFVDAGGAALDWQSYQAALGYGLGLRWRSPVGPLRIDVAYGEALRRWRLHFTVGVTF
ncbi:MAG: hypothetical protein RJA44_526, partial [Pseudomonadota bacterium]